MPTSEPEGTGGKISNTKSDLSRNSREHSKCQDKKHKVKRKRKKKSISVETDKKNISSVHNSLLPTSNKGNISDILVAKDVSEEIQTYNYGSDGSFDNIVKSSVQVEKNRVAQANWSSSSSNHSLSFVEETFCASDSFLNSETSHQKCMFSADCNKESYVGVYWDIQSCPVPETKSASDIVRKIRETFYNNCIEAEFIVLCDTRNISSHIINELDDEQATLHHVDCHKINVIDQRLGDYLRKFGKYYRHSQSCVVVISGDCNFVNDFHELRYWHRVKVFILHSADVQTNLKFLVNSAQLFEDFYKDLPDCKTYKQFAEVDDSFVLNKHSIVQKLYSDSSDRDSNTSQSKTNEDSTVEVTLNNNNCQIIPKESLSFNQEKEKNNDTSNLGIACKSSKEDKISFRQHNLGDEVCMSLRVSKYESKKFWTCFFQKILPDITFVVKKLYQEDRVLILGFENTNDALMASRLIYQQRMHNKAIPRELDIYSSETPYPEKSKNVAYQQNSADNTSLDYKVQTVYPKSSKKIIDDCCHLFSSKMKLLLKSHKKKMDELCEEKSTLSQSINVDGVDQKTMDLEYKKAIVNKLRTLKEQMNDFSTYVNNKQKELKTCCINLPVNKCMAVIEKVKRDFEIECDCFESGHPAYTRKASIVAVVNTFNVCAISMKDTYYNNLQICSYLLQGGLANSGEIVYVHPGNRINQLIPENEDGCILDPISKKLALHIIRKTDYSFLKECLLKGGVGNIKYIVIDNIQERYFYMDILLSVLKYYISNSKCKIVLVGTDVTSVKNFFNVKKEATVNIAEFLYPVHIIWKESSVDVGCNYVLECVGHIVNICRAADSSDNIAVFLTSMLDIQAAVSLLNQTLFLEELENIQLVHLHEMQTYKQRLITYKKDARKIVFTTDYGRLSELLPNVRYVIDCGFVLEESYNITTFSNELTVKFQNKNTAEWRKNCAGRTCPGFCYRLYSNIDYQKKMNDGISMQIPQKDLSHVLLLLFKAGIDPLQFTFCEKPSRVRLNKFLEKLIQMEAIQNNKLTELGSKLAEMNLNIDVANLVICGFNEGLFVETAVVGAISIISGYLSFQHFSGEASLQSDFIQTNGDFETVNEVYKEWLQIPKQNKNDWLNANCINCETMTVTHEIVTNIVTTASRLINGKRLKRSSDWSDKLQLLLVETFPYNLAVYSGDQNCGYQNPYNSNPLFFHPLSPLNHSGILPEFIVYQTLLKSSCSYIIGISRIKKVLLEEMEKSGIPRVQLSEYKKKMLVPIVLQPLSKVLFKRVIGRKGRRLELLKQDIKTVTESEFSEIKVSAPKSQITIHTNCQSSDVAKQYVLDLINEERTKMMDYEIDVPFDGWDSGSLKMIMGSGGEIKNILSQESSCDVFVKSTISDSALLKKLTVCGEIMNCAVGDRGITVRYKSVDGAKRAVNEFHNKTNFEVLESTRLGSLYRGVPPCHVTVSFMQKRYLKAGHITFKCENDLQETLLKLKSARVKVAGERIKFKLNKKNKNFLLLNELPERATQEDILSVLSSKLPVYITTENIVLNHEQIYSLNEEEMEDLAESFRYICSLYTNADKLSVEIPKHSDDLLVGEAKLSFENIQDAHIAVRVLKEVLVKGYEAKLNLTFSIVCSSKLFSSVKNQIQESLKLFTSDETQDNVLKISAKPHGSNVTIIADSNNVGDIEKVRRKIEEAFIGICIWGLGVTEMEEIVSDSGIELVKNLEDSLHLCIQVDIIKNIISISGETQACTAAQKVIDKFLKALKSTSRKFKLVGESVPKGLLQYLVKKYGYDFTELRISCRLASLELNFEERILIAYGNNGVTELQVLWNQLCKEVQNRNLLQTSSGNECFICLGQVDENFLCLSYCGHTFCKQCLTIQVKWGSLPLVCQKEGCKERIVWEDLKALLSNEESLIMHHLQINALRKFLNENADKYQLCPTFGCYAVYKVPESQRVFSCPCCENDVCTSCNVIYHHGMSCDMFWNVCGEIDAVKAWVNEEIKKRKLCPNCKCGIENNGKNSFTVCWKCRKFMCWLCNRLFPKLQAVENHSRTCIYSSI